MHPSYEINGKMVENLGDDQVRRQKTPNDTVQRESFVGFASPKPIGNLLHFAKITLLGKSLVTIV